MIVIGKNIVPNNKTTKFPISFTQKTSFSFFVFQTTTTKKKLTKNLRKNQFLILKLVLPYLEKI